MSTDLTAHKYAVYHKHQGWLVDTGVGGTWSWNVDDAAWFADAGVAVESLYACDLVERSENPELLGYVFPRMK
jgi:hypothetical protein